MIELENWIAQNPIIAAIAAVILLVFIYIISRLIFGRGLVYLTSLTKNKYDDIVIKNIRPFRASLLFPLIFAYSFAYLAPDAEIVIQKISLFFIVWLSILTLNGLLNAVNTIYESTPSFSGVSIQGYLEIAKIFFLIVGVILSISLITDKSPLLLLGGLGAVTAVLLLAFQDTIMALIASIQISVNNLVKEGDWLEVPSYDADGIVLNMSLHTIKIQNWDMTIAVIPTHKIMETPFKNWRGMEESGGRRIMRSIRIDQNTVKFCTDEMIENYGKIDLIYEYVANKKNVIEKYKIENSPLDSLLDGPQVTNMEIFRAYIEAYLRNNPNIHSKRMDFIIRELPPSETGLPVELYVFTRTTKWNEYERIQAEIIDHLLAAAAFFDLRLFQEPAGADFVSVLNK